MENPLLSNSDVVFVFKKLTREFLILESIIAEDDKRKEELRNQLEQLKGDPIMSQILMAAYQSIHKVLGFARIKWERNRVDVILQKLSPVYFTETGLTREDLQKKILDDSYFKMYNLKLLTIIKRLP